MDAVRVLFLLQVELYTMRVLQGTKLSSSSFFLSFLSSHIAVSRLKCFRYCNRQFALIKGLSKTLEFTFHSMIFYPNRFLLFHSPAYEHFLNPANAKF
jgi:hypothetical protein